MVQEFGKKSDDLTDVFNSYWVFGDKKTIQQVLYIRTQRHNETKILFRYKDNKRLESRHKGLQRENFVDFVSSFAAHCIFIQRKNTLYLRVFVFKIIPAE